MARDEGQEPERNLGREALAYADGLHNLARYLTGNDRDAEDLVQETYARAIKGAGQFTRGTNLKAWLFRILRNTFISQYRRERNNPATGRLDTVDERGTADPETRWFLDDPELDRLRSVVAEDIHRALMALGDDARSIILLDLEGFTEIEVAQIVGCAVGTVKSRLSRARSTLRIKLKDYAR